MIYEYELDVGDIKVNGDDNGKEQYEHEWGLNIIEENQEPLNKEGIYITEEEDNNEVDNTDIENNEDKNEMNETNDEIFAEEENYLGEDTMQRKEHNQSEEIEECDQSMERPIR